ncbi:hypothetical protein [Streptomyces tauricus]
MAPVPSPPAEGGLVRPLSCAAAPDEPDADEPSPLLVLPVGPLLASSPSPPDRVPPGAVLPELGPPAALLEAGGLSKGTNSTSPVGATAPADDAGG